MSSQALPEGRLAVAERDVAEGEQRVACMTALAEGLERRDQAEEAAVAREALAMLQVSLGLLHDQLCRVRRSLP